MMDADIWSKAMEMYPGIVIIEENNCKHFMDKEVCSAPLKPNSFFDANKTGFYGNGFQLTLRLDRMGGELHQSIVREISDETLIFLYNHNIKVYYQDNQRFYPFDTQTVNRMYMLKNIIDGE